MQAGAGLRLFAGSLCILGGLAASPTAAALAPPPAVVISPLPGTRDANPGTQVSFLGEPARDIRDVVVDGSESGDHAGRLEPYSTGTGASFVPSEPFRPGERVTVSATIRSGSSNERVGTEFTVGSPVRLTLPGPNPVRVNPPAVMRFHSAPDLKPSAVEVTKQASDPGAGDIFVVPNGPIAQTGPEILAADGQLVYFKPVPTALSARNANVQDYEGHPVLTWWQGRIVDGHGQGVDLIYNTSYQRVATVRAGNGLSADLHDFEITPQGTAWITSFAPVSWNLSPYGGRSDGVIDDGVIQEIDIKTGLVMYQWNSIGHVAIRDTHMTTPTLSYVPLDYFHVNSIDPESDGSLLISSRNTWTVYSVNESTGQVVWRLGGKHSTFKLGRGLHFAWQHDAKRQPDGTITIFDNEDAPREGSTSRAIDVALDTANDTAKLRWQLTYPKRHVLAASAGDVQRLPNGFTFVGWGQDGPFSEFSPSGRLTFAMQFRDNDTYRAYRYPWSAQPVTKPALAATRLTARTTRIYASWNGATDVARWKVLAQTSPGKLAVVGSYHSTGFETAITAPTSAPEVAVQAISAAGRTLASSAVTRVRR
jgi:hypothetical protein